MESANFHHHQQQDHELVDSSPLLYWSQNHILTGTKNGMSSRNLAPCLDNGTNSMVQDLGFSWSSGTNNMNGMAYPMENFVNHELQHLGRIKDEFSVAESYPKFLELLNCSPTASIKDLHLQPYDSSYMKNDNQDILHTIFSNGRDQIKGGQLIHDQNSCNGTFSQIFPTISISSLNQSYSTPSPSSAISSSSFDMNCLPPLDLFGSPRFNSGFCDPSSLNAHNLGGISYGLDHIHQPNHNPLVFSRKISSVVSTTGSTDQSSKRPASKCIDAKASAQSVAPKKSKSEPRFSSAPFQVRKEKLGDRIAAIQQLVAPFGKTDTASVLMEAIGYIKFLQNQVETLSVPYMKPSDKIGGISTQRGQTDDGNKRAKRDLRSRGLCLVPLSCLSYVTDGTEGVWPTP